VKKMVEAADADVSIYVRLRSELNCVVGADRKSVALGGSKSFRFNQIFDAKSSQQNVYDSLGPPLIDNVLRGYNCCLMAYGATGSGKTHTMMGINGPMGQGLIPRIVTEMFERIGANDQKVRTTVQCNYVEIYTENIRDLLASGPGKGPTTTTAQGQKGLKLRSIKFQPVDKALPPQTYTYIEGCNTCSVSTVDDVLRVLAYGSARRATSSTNLNEHSSRSHSVLIVSVLQIDLESQVRTTSRLFMVDLAGSEMVERSGVVGQQLTEACHINKSLSTLSLVINAVVEQLPHVPYRNSKLTRLLSDAFGGNSKVSLVLTVNTSSDDQVAESVRTLQFGARASSMKNKVRANVEVSIETYKEIIRQLETKIEQLELALSVHSRQVLTTTEDFIVPTLSARGTGPNGHLGPNGHMRNASRIIVTDVVTDSNLGEAELVKPEQPTIVELEEQTLVEPSTNRNDQVENMNQSLRSLELLFSLGNVMVVGPGIVKFTQY